MKMIFNRYLPRKAGAVLLGITGLLAAAAIAPPLQPAASAQAAVETETFAIENMTCALCPLTVRKAMQDVPGVSSVKVDFDAKQAIVTYDPALTTVAAIEDASTKAGYPAKSSR